MGAHACRFHAGINLTHSTPLGVLRDRSELVYGVVLSKSTAQIPISLASPRIALRANRILLALNSLIVACSRIASTLYIATKENIFEAYISMYRHTEVQGAHTRVPRIAHPTLPP
jgi:hypothetical protein